MREQCPNPVCIPGERCWYPECMGDLHDDLTAEAYEAHTGCCFVCKGTTVHGDGACPVCHGTGEAKKVALSGEVGNA